MKKVDYYKIFIIYKNEWNNLLSKKKRNNIIRAKGYYQNIKEVLREIKNKKEIKYKDLSEEDKNVKRKYGRNRYQNVSEKRERKIKKI